MKETYKKSDDDIDLKEIVKLFWYQRIKIILFSAAFAIVSVLYALSLDNTYRATVSILPQSTDNVVSKFSGLANLAGIDLSSQATSNEKFYKDVLVSDKILNKLIQKKWSIETLNSEMYIHEFLKIPKDESHFDPKAKLEYETKKYLRTNVIRFTPDKNNGIMRLSVTVPRDPKLSSVLANWLSNELHEFNEKFRQNRVNDNLQNIKEQLSIAKEDLTVAENNISEFQMNNKNFNESTELNLKYERLNREVITENTVYTELRRQFEIAKIDLEKKKETITILDHAITPVVKNGPKRAMICITITMIGFILTLAYIFIRYRIQGEDN